MTFGMANPLVIGLTYTQTPLGERQKWIANLVKQTPFDSIVLYGPNWHEGNWKARVGPAFAKLTQGELCCNATHHLAYRVIVKTNRPAILLEDDISFIPGRTFDDFVDLEIPNGTDYIKISKPLLQQPTFDTMEIREKGEHFDLLKLGTWGTEALFVTPKGARRILEFNYPTRYATDVVTKYCCGKVNLTAYQMVNPIFVGGKFKSHIRTNTDQMTCHRDHPDLIELAEEIEND